LPLSPPDPNSTLTVLLGNAVRAGVQVRGMFWAGIMVPSLPAAPALVPGELLRDYLTENQAPRVFNVEAVNAINAMGAPGVDAAAILDSEHAFAASHHQKILVLGIAGQLIAYNGGIDFSADQLPPPDATAPGTPVFDVAVRLEDGGAWLALNTFKTRWNAHPNKPAGPPLRSDSLPIPLPAGGPLTVQMTHTSGKGFPLPAAVQTASTALASAIRNARQFFYMEDQYCVGSPKLAAAIVEALTQTPGLTGIFVITPDVCVKAFEMPDMPFRRRAFLKPIVRAFPSRFLVFERLGAGTITGPTAYIHSKLLIVDDEAAFIGSVNASRRSWFHDTEAQVAIVDELNGRGGTSSGTRGWVRDLRCQVWSQHLTRPQASLGDPFVDLSIWRDIVKGTVTGSSVRPYDALATVPRFSVAGQTLGDDPLDRLWDNVEDPY
jgi:phosphatidylserine/phosphatidylglycerophosphate/cardiolipin synthase-like enzyme